MLGGDDALLLAASLLPGGGHAVAAGLVTVLNPML